ncbi:MAG: MASE3 domain-containing protein, partial [bacterium]|nr:MASE3 domain-containing protein [bacterium]
MNQRVAIGQWLRANWGRAASMSAVIISLAWISRYNYLLFHSLVEIFAVIVAGSVFIIVWNSRRFLQNSYFIFLGVTALFIGFILLLHALAYKGMNIFSEQGANVATQLWVLSRYILGFSFILAPLAIKRHINMDRLLAGYALIVGLLLGTIFYWKVFPVCYIEGSGLTTFKKSSEYISVFTFLAALVMIAKSRLSFDLEVRNWLMACLAAFAISELFFFSYINVYGISNTLGHFFELAGFYLLYKATVEIGLAKPYQLIFRELKHSEELLQHNREELAQLVIQRTAELATANAQLQADMTELQDKEIRIKTNNELLKLRTQAFSRKEYLDHVVRLVRVLAGCHCVGIRVVNDEGKIPYESYTGFSQQFWESENWLELAKDQCACIRVIAGTPEPQDLPALTKGGSFCCGNILSFVANLSAQEQSRFRGVCVKQGYATVIIIPIKYNEKNYGAIHLADKRAVAVSAQKLEFLEALTPIIGEGIYKFIMADKMEEAKKELADAKRLSDIGVLAATVAHE